MLRDHPSPSDFEGFLRNASEPGHTTRNARVLRHLLASCRVCRGRLEALGWSASRLDRLIYLPGKADGRETRERGGYNYDQAFARTERIIEDFLAEPRPSPVRVEQLLEELKLVPREQQISLLESDDRFAVPQLVDLFIERSHSTRYDDPEAMRHWALLAQSAASRSAAEALGSETRLADLRARAWGQYGNALRVNGLLREAESAMATSRRYLAAGTGDPLLKAKILEQSASLSMFQRRFEEAVTGLTEAAELHRMLGDSHALARALVQKSLVLLYSHESDQAIVLLNQAIPMIDHESDPHLLLVACHNLMMCFIDLGQPERALSIYQESQDLYREFSDSLIRLRAGWQEGQLLQHLGHLKAAEEALLRARQGFQERGLMYEVAVVCLDLAAVYVKLKSLEDLKETVTVALPIFRGLGVDRDALAALLQLQQVASQEQQAMELIRFLSARIEPFAKHGLLK